VLMKDMEYLSHVGGRTSPNYDVPAFTITVPAVNEFEEKILPSSLERLRPYKYIDQAIFPPCMFHRGTKLASWDQGQYNDKIFECGHFECIEQGYAISCAPTGDGAFSKYAVTNCTAPSMFNTKFMVPTCVPDKEDKTCRAFLAGKCRYFNLCDRQHRWDLLLSVNKAANWRICESIMNKHGRAYRDYRGLYLKKHEKLDGKIACIVCKCTDLKLCACKCKSCGRVVCNPCPRCGACFCQCDESKYGGVDEAKQIDLEHKHEIKIVENQADVKLMIDEEEPNGVIQPKVVEEPPKEGDPGGLDLKC